MIEGPLAAGREGGIQPGSLAKARRLRKGSIGERSAGSRMSIFNEPAAVAAGDEVRKIPQSTQNESKLNPNGFKK